MISPRLATRLSGVRTQAAPPRPLVGPAQPLTPSFVPSAADVGVLPCARAGVDPDEVFFPTDTTAIRSGEAARSARAVCGPCPLQDPCRQWAAEQREWGTWGGESQQERLRTFGIAPRHASCPSRRSRRADPGDTELLSAA
ncbi:WhiB family transcriptional regulator [Streptomyces sp. NPDC051555]|uniref:WhiB family transcriptional regulator n=1 Tax=Streptomyces sp. NPDC051555 TaxID=3365657 RepID=UPI0037ABAE11